MDVIEEMFKLMLYSGTDDVNNRYEEVENPDAVEVNHRGDIKNSRLFLKNKKRIIGECSKKGRTITGLGFTVETKEIPVEDMYTKCETTKLAYHVDEYIFYKDKDGKKFFKKIGGHYLGADKLSQPYFEIYKDYLISKCYYVELPLDFREQLKKPEDGPKLK